MMIFKENGLFGIKNIDRFFVPPVYENPLEAISEWKYFEVENTKKKFLPWMRTIEEIEFLEKKMMRMYKITFLI